MTFERLDEAICALVMLRIWYHAKGDTQKEKDMHKAISGFFDYALRKAASK